MKNQKKNKNKTKCNTTKIIKNYKNMLKHCVKIKIKKDAGRGKNESNINKWKQNWENKNKHVENKEKTQKKNQKKTETIKKK